MKKVFPGDAPGTDIFPQKSPVEGKEKRDASRLSRKPPVEGKENCPHCGSANLSKGAGLKPGQMSLKCGECKAFLGYKNLQQLEKLKRRKRLTPCLELLEKQGLEGDAAIFVLGQVGGEA
jgi:DNA-directed RNA polymerase subunit RPC12/RpoP